jgi:uncharacterized protein
MSSLAEHIRTLDLVVFSDESLHVLFYPPGFQMFLLSEMAARAIRAITTSEISVQVAASRLGVQDEAIEQLLSQLVALIESAQTPQIRPAAALQAGQPLPKLVFMVNNFCNLSCRYCYEHEPVFTQPKKVMSHEIVQSAVSKFFDAFGAVHTIMFIGGEPTLSPGVIELACQSATEEAAARNQPAPQFCMISNGARMDEQTFQIVDKYHIQVTFSIDGPQQVNDLVRIRHDGSGATTEVLANIRRYHDSHPEQTGLECTVTAAHKGAGIAVTDLLMFAARDVGVKIPHIAAAGLPAGHPLNPYGPNAPWMEAGFHAASEQSVQNLLGALLSDGHYEPQNGALDYVAGIFESVVRRKGFLTMCPAGTAQLVVDAHGDIYPCWMFAGKSEFMMGNILRDDIFNAVALRLLGRIAKNTKDQNPYCSSCYARYVCSACMGNNQNATGSIEEMNETFCRTMRDSVKTVVVSLAKIRRDPAQWEQLRRAAGRHQDNGAQVSQC